MSEPADGSVMSEKCQYELTERYLSGELTFLQYAELLGDDGAGSGSDINQNDDDDDEDDQRDDEEQWTTPVSTPTAENPCSSVTSRNAELKKSPLTSRKRRGGATSTISGAARTARRPRRNRHLPPAFQGMLGEANLTFARGNAEAAERLCKEVIRQCPSACEPFRTLAMLYEDRGDMDRSFQCRLICAHLAATATPLHEWLWLAEAAAHRQLYKEAADCYRRACKVSPSDLQLHYKQLEYCRLSGDNSAATAVRILHYALRHTVSSADAAFSLLKQLNEILLEKRDYQTATRCAALVFKHHGAVASWEDAHQYIEVLLNSERYRQCVQFVCEHCHVIMTSPQDDDDDDVDGSSPALTLDNEQFRRHARVHVSSSVPLDVKYKLLLALVYQHCTASSQQLLEELLQCEVETFGDLYLDVAEALMSVQRLSEARTVLSRLINNTAYCKAGTWLLMAECLSRLQETQEAVAAYERVVQLAPHHSEARIQLSRLLVTRGQHDRAVQALTSDAETGWETGGGGGVPLDSVLLLEKCHLLEQLERSDMLVDTVQVLLTQHCPVISNRHQATSMLVLPKTRGGQMADSLSGCDALSDNTCAPFVERVVELDEHWRLLLLAVRRLETQQRYQRCLFLVLRARGSQNFINVPQYSARIDQMTVVAALRARDVELGFSVVRKLILAAPTSSQPWNLLNLMTMQTGDVTRHTRFLMRLTPRLCDVVALCLLNGNTCFLAGTYKYALVEYLTAYKMHERSWLAPLLVAVTFVQRLCQRLVPDKPALMTQAFAFLQEYAETRSQHCSQEALYNQGRAMHQLGLLADALHYYTRALHTAPAEGRGQGGVTLDLRAEIGYNLALIYNDSGNHHMAAELRNKYCVI